MTKNNKKPKVVIINFDDGTRKFIIDDDNIETIEIFSKIDREDESVKLATTLSNT